MVEAGAKRLRLNQLRPGDVIVASWLSNEPNGMLIGSYINDDTGWTCYIFLSKNGIEIASASAGNTLLYNVVIRA